MLLRSGNLLGRSLSFARVCVVEPAAPLPGGVMDFTPGRAAELIQRGEEDAWAALERAGWLAATPV